MQTTASLSRAVLALSLIWRGATSYTPLGPIVAAHSHDVVRAGEKEQRCFPRPRNAVGILKSSSGGNCHASSNRKNGSSTPPPEGGSSRRKFLRQLVGSSVAVLACSSVVGATGATASVPDSVPDGERRDAISGLVSAFYAVWSHMSRHERRRDPRSLPRGTCTAGAWAPPERKTKPDTNTDRVAFAGRGYYRRPYPIRIAIL